MRRILATAAGALLALAPLTAVSAAPPPPVTRPGVFYAIDGSCGGGLGGCSNHIQISYNPSNTGVQAWQECSDGTFQYGGWKYSVGQISNTANCPSSDWTVLAGFLWRHDNPVQRQCYDWYFNNPRNGSC